MTQYLWTRYWAPFGGVITVDEGYLAAPRNDFYTINAELLSTDALPECPLLVLLGEAGIGKSSEAARYVERVGACKLEFRDYGDELRLQQHVESLFQRAGAGTCVLDGLDEALLGMPKAVGVIKSCLKSAVTKPRVVLTCRTGAWVRSFHQDLESIAKDIKTFELCSLQEIDVRNAARAESIDAEAFMREIRDRRVETLASSPVTLQLLMNLYRGGSLPTSRVELYRKGLKRLCEQPEERRDAGNVPRVAGRELTADDLYATAVIIAATVTLGGRVGVYTGSKSRPEAEETLRAALFLEEIREEDASAEALTDSWSSERIRMAVAHTGIFSARASQLFGFVHKSYAEFLAAEYLATAGMKPAQRRSLLAAPDDPEAIAPQLREVAAWLADIDADFGHDLMSDQPEVLLRSDLRQRPAEHRRTIIDRLLCGIETERIWSLDGLVNPDGSLHFVSPMRLVRPLSHDGLEDQLRPWIGDGSRNKRAREAAIELAVECGVRSLADDCVSAALDSAAPLDLRIQAVRAAKDLDNTAALRRLRPLATGDLLNTQPALLRHVVETLWPLHLSAAELIAAFDTRAWNDPHGDAHWMCLQLAEHVPSNALVEILTWGADHPDNHGSGQAPGEFVSRVAHRAWEQLDEPGVLSALAALIVRRLSRHDRVIIAAPHSDVFSLRDTGKHPHQYMIDDLPKRRRLLEACLPLVSQPGGYLFWLQHNLPLARTEDYEWALERACDRNGEEAARYASLASWLGNFFGDDQVKAAARLDRWLDAMQRSESVRSATKWPTVVSFGSETETKQREEWDQHLQWKREASERHESRQLEKPDIPRAQYVVELLKRCHLDCRWFPQMTHVMMYDDEYEWAGSSLNPLAHSGWKLADEATRDAIAEAALNYLTDCPLRSDSSTADDVVLTVDSSRTALQIVAQHIPDRLGSISPDRVRAAMPLLLDAAMRWNSEGRNGWDHAVRLLGSAAGDDFNQALYEWISANRNSVHLPMLDDAAKLADTRGAETRLLRSVMSEWRDDFSAQRLLPWLVKRGTPGAHEHAVDVIELAHAQISAVHERFCAIALLAASAETGWPVVEAAVSSNTGWGKDLIESIAPSWHDDAPLSGVVQSLTTEQLATFALTLARLFPFDESSREQSNSQTASSRVARWRDTALFRLASSGTRTAVNAFDQLVQQFPSVEGLKRLRLEAESARQRSQWSPVLPSHLLSLKRRSAFRLVRGSGELLEVLAEQLEAWHTRIKQAATESSTWDRQGGKNIWRPKDEESLRDRIQSDLAAHLTGVVLGREVQLSRRNSAEGARGNRVDIHAVALPDSRSGDSSLASVILEVKGSWNDEAASGLTDQLAERYLSEYQTMYGLYLVLWFGEAGWDPVDHRRRRGPWRTVVEARTDLHARAVEVMKVRQGLRITPLVLDLSLP